MASNLVKAVRIEQHGGPEVLKVVEIEVSPPAADEVTIRQHAAGLNFIDIYFRTGLYPHPLPHGLGFEGAGVVIEVGRECVASEKRRSRRVWSKSDRRLYAGAQCSRRAGREDSQRHQLRGSRRRHVKRSDGPISVSPDLPLARS